MNSIYTGISASGRPYNTLATALTESLSEDIILINPMSDGAYYDSNVTFPTDKSIFLKGDVPANYNHKSLLLSTAPKAYLYASGGDNPILTNCGLNSTTYVVFESLHLQIAGTGMQFAKNKYGNFIFNKCRITMSYGNNSYPLIKYLSAGFIEFRNCHIDFTLAQPFTGYMGDGANVNIIKCTTNRLASFDEVGNNNNSRLFRIGIKDIIDSAVAIDGYGVTGGTELFTTDYPIISGRLLDNGVPIIKPVYLYLKDAQKKVAQTTSDATGYFEFDARNYLGYSLVLVTLKDPTISDEYIILNDIRAVDRRS